MLMKIEKRAALVLLIVTVFLILFYICFGVLFPNTGAAIYTEDTPDGTRVILEGEILSTRITATGGHCLLNVSGVTVFVEGGAENIFYQTGDRVQIVGIAETYAGSREIVVDTSGSIQLL